MQKSTIIIGIIIFLTICFLAFTLYIFSRKTSATSLSSQIAYNQEKINKLQLQINNSQQELKTLKTNNDQNRAILLGSYENLRNLAIEELQRQAQRYDTGLFQNMIENIQDVSINYSDLIDQSKYMRLYINDVIFEYIDKEKTTLSEQITALELKREEQTKLIATFTTTLKDLQDQIAAAKQEESNLTSLNLYYSNAAKNFNVFKKKLSDDVDTLLDLTNQINVITKLIEETNLEQYRKLVY